MKTEANLTDETIVARSLAAEDLRRGDFVSVLHEVVELPSYFWSCDSHVLPPAETVKVPIWPADGGTPLKVKQICLPFVFVKLPCGKHRTLDVRRHRLVKLSEAYARTVWKTMNKAATTRPGNGLLTV
jgi:hypothetical protein